MVKLGDTVKCRYTGFKGVAVARTEFINGCIQFGVVAKWDGKSIEPQSDLGIDEDALEVIKPKPKKKVTKTSNGGPMRRLNSRKY